jgi:hypothetical protein
MPGFVYESLLWWGLPLVALPVLIHLINLMRHRRVPWAAMEFLLASQKRHQKSILFKQWLLLLLRMLAIAAVVLMVAQPVVRNRWGAMFGGSTTHHVLLLDDSFSMSDRWADTSAFNEAKRVAARLGASAEHQDSPQFFTLLRFSRAAQLARGGRPDMLAEPVDAGFEAKLEKALGELNASQTAAGPDEALAALDRLPPKGADENRIVYLLSDFRTSQWQDPAALVKSMSRIDQTGAQIHLVDCAEGIHQNLAIVGLRAASGTRAAGVPLTMEVTVRNFGPGAKERVSVVVEDDGHPRPAVVIEELPPGKSATRRFSVLFTSAGQHEVTARLESDAVDIDNRRWAVVDVPLAADVLIIDGDAKARDAYFLATALAPGGKITSGIKPLIETPSYLRNHALDGFETIYLANVPRLEDVEIDALETFVKGGGGLAIFLGELSRAAFYNDKLYRNGEGLFPLPLAGPAELPVERLDKAPDIEAGDHPIFSVFAGERNSFLNLVVVNRYFAAERNWAPAPESSVKVIARLRNKAPLAVERQFGQGRVVAILTKAAPVETELGSWNNWARDNPSFVVAMLEMQSYLAAPRHPDAGRLVGTALSLGLDTSKVLPQVRFVPPGDDAGASVTVDATADGPAHKAVLADPGAAGIYQAQLTRIDGSPAVERFAYNVSGDEGDLRKIEPTQMAGRLSGLRYEFHRSGDITYNPQQLAGFNLSESLLYALLGVLLVESGLAYAASYHPQQLRGAK